jgi:hypothetical protein
LCLTYTPSVPSSTVRISFPSHPHFSPFSLCPPPLFPLAFIFPPFSYLPPSSLSTSSVYRSNSIIPRALI